jgi:hypothetical protein
MDQMSGFEKILYERTEEQQTLLHNLALRVQEMATHYKYLVDQVKKHDRTIEFHKKWFWRISGAWGVVAFMWAVLMYFIK